jgi:hypothetical protein
MYTIKLDSVKNRIYIDIEGMISINEVDDYNNKFMKAIDAAKPNFTICVDLLKSAVNRPEVAEKMNIPKEYATKKGYKSIAMIVNSIVFKMQIKRAYGEKEGFFETLEEAEAYLDN